MRSLKYILEENNMMKLNMFDAVTYSAVPGKKIVILLRVLEKASAAPAALIPFGTTDSENISADSDTTVTKDGAIVTPGAASVELSKEALMSINSGDPDGSTSIDDLKDAMKTRKKVEAWVVNLDRPGTRTNKYLGTYYQGFLTSFETESAAEDLATVSMDYSAEGVGVDGECTVDTDTQQIASYVFKDTVQEI